MAIRLTGLNSGLDTDAMVKELVSAYSTKKDKYVKAKTKHEWKMSAWTVSYTHLDVYKRQVLNFLQEIIPKGIPNR